MPVPQLYCPNSRFCFEKSDECHVFYHEQKKTTEGTEFYTEDTENEMRVK